MAALAEIPVPPAQLQRPRSADIGHADAAGRYEQGLSAHFGLHPGGMPVFDFILLHESAGGRISGYAAHETSAANVTRLVVVHQRGRPRIALALPVIDAARVAVLFCERPGGSGAGLLRPQGELHCLSPSTARSSGVAMPPTVRASRSGLPPS
jgi:hypothetical protein